MKNCAILKNKLFAIENNTSLLKNNSALLKHLWYKKKIFANILPKNIVNIATWKTIQYRKTNSSLLQKILCCWKKSLCYWNKCFAVEKNVFTIDKNVFAVEKNVFAIGKNVFAIEIPLTSKKCSLYCQYCNQIGGLPSLWSLFMPTFSVSNIMGTMLVFNGICFPLDVRKCSNSSKCSEHKIEVSVGRQLVLLSFSIQTSKSFESFIGNLRTKW